jgi:hypothetical protein
MAVKSFFFDFENMKISYFLFVSFKIESWSIIFHPKIVRQLKEA